MSKSPTLAVIGGSGLYAMEGLQNVQYHSVETPFGEPSAPIVTGELQAQTVAFLARHGLGHTLTPGEVNYRANIFALKQLGVERIISISACGSLREDYAPGSLVIPDQLFDFTRDRHRSFYGDGFVAHIGVAEPFCADLSMQLHRAVLATGAIVHYGGAFITIEGPRFSTKAESNVYRAWGMSIIGMTTSPEAFLAREAELCYAVMAHVTDYDVWHVSEAPVSVDAVIAVLHQNTQIAQQAVQNLVNQLSPERSCACNRALADARITDPQHIPPQTQKRLNLLTNKYSINSTE
jgi:5'-methylthioadenosine phosphorylase